LHNKVRKKTLLELYYVLAIPFLLCGSKSWMLKREKLRRIEGVEMYL
jgi:hypothetical protein